MHFGEDHGDLAHLNPEDEPLKPGEYYPMLCEGCGFIRVDAEGKCLSSAPDCLENHNAAP